MSIEAVSVVHVNRSDNLGGAARAAYRIHDAVRHMDVRSTMRVCISVLDDPSVESTRTGLGRAMDDMRRRLGTLVPKLLRTGNPILHSPAIVPTLRSRLLNRDAADIVHLHWINEEMLSVRDIARIRKPVVWTFHDMWPFCGAEHYTDDERWRDGYRPGNRPEYESGWDINRWTWRRKQRAWQKSIHVVAPSRWLADCVSRSALMKSWPVSVIPNPIDTERWRPLNKAAARKTLGLPKESFLILFGSGAEVRDPRKGFEYLAKAAATIRKRVPTAELVLVGNTDQKMESLGGMPVHLLGRIDADDKLPCTYSAMDVLALPSLQDNLPNMAIEAQACGLPSVAFRVGGFPDIIDHLETGYLARPRDAEDLANGIVRLLDDADRGAMMQRCRAHAEATYSYAKVGSAYRTLYRDLLRGAS
jgi:glycosyltransferase involved in cell wall biosynthesis